MVVVVSVYHEHAHDPACGRFVLAVPVMVVVMVEFVGHTEPPA
jgi:hypothetical protein